MMITFKEREREIAVTKRKRTLPTPAINSIWIQRKKMKIENS